MILSEMTVLRNQSKAREEPVSWILKSFNLIEWNQIVGPVCFFFLNLGVVLDNKIRKIQCYTWKTDFDKLLKLQSNAIGPQKYHSVWQINANIVQIPKEEK